MEALALSVWTRPSTFPALAGFHKLLERSLLYVIGCNMMRPDCGDYLNDLLLYITVACDNHYIKDQNMFEIKAYIQPSGLYDPYCVYIDYTI